MQRRTLLTFSAAAFALAGCDHLKEKAAAPAPSVTSVDAKVSISRDRGGQFVFKYDSPYADADGNFNFAEGEAAKASVNLTFTIADDGGLGFKFLPDGRQAIWIVEKARLANTRSTSPLGPYEGKQFRDFRVSPDGRTLTLFNENNDGVLYRYALRFNMGAETVAHDPDMENGTGGHGGGSDR